VSTVNIINNLFAFFVIYLFIILPLSVNLGCGAGWGKKHFETCFQKFPPY